MSLINKTLDRVEDSYSGVKKNLNAASMPDRDDGRMYGILDNKYITRNDDGSVIAKTKGNNIIIQPDGSFQVTIAGAGLFWAG